ncbi:MAG TPA: hypothetical protein VMZ52_10350 [Bryobacteraceae bacterium]|nr:hypothetical protein [Bryobacteraceae bacterium]
MNSCATTLSTPATCSRRRRLLSSKRNQFGGTIDGPIRRNKTFFGADVATGRIVIPNGALSKVSAFFPKTFAGVVGASRAGYPGQKLIRNDTTNFRPAEA